MHEILYYRQDPYTSGSDELPPGDAIHSLSIHASPTDSGLWFGFQISEIYENK